MVRCAWRAARFDCPFCAVFRILTGPSPAPVLVLPLSADEASLGATEPFAGVRDRRDFRRGDNRELAGGSPNSHATAAAETDGGSAGALGVLDDGRPDGAVLEGAV